jgi:cytochrome c553
VGQRAAYLERQLLAFSQGVRRNDINEQMRTLASQLTPREIHAIAAFYASPADPPASGKRSVTGTTAAGAVVGEAAQPESRAD